MAPTCHVPATHVTHLLEKVGSIGKSKEGHCIGHHPDVASAAVEVRLTPFAVLVGDAEDFVVVALRVGRFVGRVRVISCQRHTQVQRFFVSQE